MIENKTFRVAFTRTDNVVKRLYFDLVANSREEAERYAREVDVRDTHDYEWNACDCVTGDEEIEWIKEVDPQEEEASYAERMRFLRDFCDPEWEGAIPEGLDLAHGDGEPPRDHQAFRDELKDM